jgi:hypothetical protein
VYAWHLSALSLCVAAMAAGPGWLSPDRLTRSWWASRPLWWAAVVALTGGLVALSGAVRAGGEGGAAVRPAAGAAVAVLAAGAVGLWGPRTVDLAAVCTGLFGLAWWLLADRPVSRAIRPRLRS